MAFLCLAWHGYQLCVRRSFSCQTRNLSYKFFFSALSLSVFSDPWTGQLVQAVLLITLFSSGLVLPQVVFHKVVVLHFTQP